jgi:hypothetical protein
MVVLGAVNWRTFRVPSVLASYITHHHCSYFSYYSPQGYEIYLLTSLCKLLSSVQGEISFETISSRLCPVFIRYIKLCFHAVNCKWNEYGQYNFIQFIKISEQIYFLHLNFVYPEDRNSMLHCYVWKSDTNFTVSQPSRQIPSQTTPWEQHVCNVYTFFPVSEYKQTVA